MSRWRNDHPDPFHCSSTPERTGKRQFPIAASQYLRVDRDSSTPLTVQLTRRLTRLIASGGLDEGEQLPPVRRRASSVGVNMHTVRTVYQRLAAAGLVELRPGIGTRVLTYDAERVAAVAPGAPSFAIGVVIPELNPFYTPMLHAIEVTLRDEPVMLFLCNSRDDPRRASQLIDQLLARGVDGIIVAAQYEPGRLTGSVRSPACVVVDDPATTEPSVGIDQEGGAYAAATHLIAVHGYDRIGLITGPPAWRNVAQARAGVDRALNEHGLGLPDDLVVEVSDFFPQSGAWAAERLLDPSHPPHSIIAAADTLAVGVLQAARARRLEVPDDLAVVGMDDIEMADLIDPALSTVRLPAAELGSTAAEMLRRLMAQESLDEEHVTLPTRFIGRRSCGC